MVRVEACEPEFSCTREALEPQSIYVASPSNLVLIVVGFLCL